MDPFGESTTGLTTPKAESAKGARPVTNLWILGTMILLLVLTAGVAFLAMPRGSVLEPEEARAELFGSVAQPLPFGLALKGGRRLPTKELVVTYGREGEGSSDGLGEPIELTFMEFPRQRAESVLEEQFQKLRFEDSERGGGRGRGRGRGGRGGRGGGGDGEGDGGGSRGSSRPKLQDAGFLDWQGFSANFARLRHAAPKQELGPASEPESEPDPKEETERGGGEKGSSPKGSKTYDTVRVNLSTGGRCIIAYVRFPVGATGSKEVVQELLESFKPL